MFATYEQIQQVSRILSEISDIVTQHDSKIEALTNLPSLIQDEFVKQEMKIQNLHERIELLVQMSNTLSEYCDNHNNKINNLDARINAISEIVDKQREMIMILARTIDPRFVE